MSETRTRLLPQGAIHTDRLILRFPEFEDAVTIQSLLQEKEIAANTRTIPYPYPEGAAREWIVQQNQAIDQGEALVFVICRPAGASDPATRSPVIGAVGLAIDQQNENAELGYWLGKPYWGRGYCTEAVRAMLVVGFDTLGLHRVHAHHMTRNPASGRVLEKAGMRREGLLRHHTRKWGAFEDIVFYGMLDSDPRPV